MVSVERGEFLHGYSGRILLVSSLAWATIQTSRFLLPPLLPAIQHELSLTLGQVGLVLTIFQACYALFQYPSGRLSDSWNRTTLIVPGLCLLTAGCLFIGNAASFFHLVLATSLFGVGKGFFAIPSRAIISDLYVNSRGRALGLFGAGSDFGGVLAAGLAVITLSVATWREPFVPLSVLLAGLTLIFLFCTREPLKVKPTNLGILQTTHRLAKSSHQRWTLVAYILFYFMINGVLNFLPAYLQQVKGFSTELASACFALLFLVGMVIKPITGWASDRFSRRLVATTGLLVTFITLIVLLFVDSVAITFLTIGLFAMGYKGQTPVIDAILLDAAPDQKMGGDLGAARTLFIGIGSLGAGFVGVTADIYSYTVSFAFLAVCVLIAAVILVWQEPRTNS